MYNDSNPRSSRNSSSGKQSRLQNEIKLLELQIKMIDGVYNYSKNGKKLKSISSKCKTSTVVFRKGYLTIFLN